MPQGKKRCLQHQLRQGQLVQHDKHTKLKNKKHKKYTQQPKALPQQLSLPQQQGLQPEWQQLPHLQQQQQQEPEQQSHKECSIAPDHKQQRPPGEKDDEVRRLFRAWAWKREHRPDRDRFQRPYIHLMQLQDSSGNMQQLQINIKQKKFKSEGFASTVWDSSIVVAKYLEKLGPDALSGKRCLDLSAGCGLVGVVMAKLGAGQVVASDLGPNLPLLRENCDQNGVSHVSVVEHRWGCDVQQLLPTFDIIAACDVMYVDELVSPLLESLLHLTNPSTLILVAHGRNRPAEAAFKAAAAQHFRLELVPGAELDEVYQCNDVDVLSLKRLAAQEQPVSHATL